MTDEVGGDDAGSTLAPRVLDGSVHQLDRRARLDFMFDRTLVVVILMVCGVVVALVAGFPVAVPAVVAVSVALISIEAFVASMRWKRFTWQAEPEALELHHGIVVRRSSFVPYHRIQQIDLRQRPAQRVLGLSTLILRTAAATTDAELPGVATSDADALRQELLHRAGLDDAV
jgi:membrane protein YdbS with pleckstrin-like domain